MRRWILVCDGVLPADSIDGARFIENRRRFLTMRAIIALAHFAPSRFLPENISAMMSALTAIHGIRRFGSLNTLLTPKSFLLVYILELMIDLRRSDAGARGIYATPGTAITSHDAVIPEA